MLKNKIRINLAVTLIIMAFFLTGVISFAGEMTDDKTTFKEVSQEVKEAVISIKGYSTDKRDDAFEKVSVIIDDMDSRIDELENRIENKWDQLDQTARKKKQITLKALRKRRNDLSEWYGSMKHSSSHAWQHVKEGFLTSYETLSNAYNDAVKEF